MGQREKSIVCNTKQRSFLKHVSKLALEKDPFNALSNKIE